MQSFEERFDNMTQNLQKQVAMQQEKIAAHERTINQLKSSSLKTDKHLLKLTHFSALVGISALVLAAMFGVFFGLIINVNDMTNFLKHFLDVF